MNRDNPIVVLFVTGLLTIVIVTGILFFCGELTFRSSPAVVPPEIERGPAPDELRLLDAIRTVESAGNDRAVGASGERGPYSITKPYWTDGCRQLGVFWSYDKYVWSRAHCEAVMRAYWNRYGAVTDEEKARMHVGGPRGHLKMATLPYWRKVQALLETSDE